MSDKKTANNNRIIPVEPFDCVIFGATGDLSERKLIPALYHRVFIGQINSDNISQTRIIGVARREMTKEAFRSFATNAIKAHVSEDQQNPETLETFLSMLDYVQADANDENGQWSILSEKLALSPQRIRLYYLAVGPSIFATIVGNLEKYDLVSQNSRLILEKPIGKDLQSAIALNDSVAKVFSEDQIFRIDHYLGKETVQNLMSLRFANVLFEPLWSREHIEHIQVTVAETLGVEGREDYYDQSGAMRDMVQNHILQLLCLVAMEAPSKFSANAVRDEKLKVLRALKPITAKNVSSATVRGQYDQGILNGKKVRSYIDEITAEESSTETFVAIKTEIENFRWSGVPFYLRTGKRMPARMSEIVVQFKALGHNIFGQLQDSLDSNRLVIRLQPNEGIGLEVMMKDPGRGGMRFKKTMLDVTFAEAFHGRNPDAYERLIMDVVRGDQTLFMRRDEIEQAWQWVDPIINAWREAGNDMETYEAGSSGPQRSTKLIATGGHIWADITDAPSWEE